MTVPSRWVVGLTGSATSHHRAESLHAAVSRWLDTTRQDHADNHKDWSLGPIHATSAGAALLVNTLTDRAAARLHTYAQPGRSLRLDQAMCPITHGPVLLEEASWQQLAEHHHDRVWTLRFHTPTTFRQGQRSTPLPKPESVLHSLADRWTHWTAQPIDHASFHDVYVSDLNLSSRTLRLRGQIYSGTTGTITFRTESSHAQAHVGPLLHMAPFTGVGSKTTYGLGHTSLQHVPTAATSAGVGAATTTG